MRALTLLPLVAAACLPLERTHPCDVNGGAFDLPRCHERQGVQPGGAGALCRADVDCGAHFKCEDAVCTFFNSEPAAAADRFSVLEDEAKRLPVTENDNDPDGDALLVTSVSQGRNGIVTVSDDGVDVIYTPLPNTFGIDAFTYTIDDGNGGSRTGSVTVEVTAVNDAPLLLTSSIAANEESTVTVQLAVVDPDGDIVEVDRELVVQPQHGVALVANNALSYTPFFEYAGPDALTIAFSDGAVTVQAELVVEVFGVNDPPSAALRGPATDPVDEDGDGVVDVAFDAADSRDNDDAALDFAWRVDGDDVAAPNASNVVLALTPGSHTVTVVVSDAIGATSSAAVDVTVIPTRLFVVQGALGVGDGFSWENAFTDLQQALTLARDSGAVKEIWVAAGRYVPSQVFDFEASFALVPGVLMLGGFAGGETSADERDPDVNPTTLSGDLFGDDQPGFSNRGENSLHVVSAVLVPPTTVVDGFTISGGHARLVDDCCDDRNGAAIFIKDAAPVISNVVITDNFEEGGGIGGIISAANSSPVIKNSVIIGNRSQAQFGGAFGANAGTSRLENVMFLGNSGGSFGAGAAVNVGVLDVDGCLFAGNGGAEFGGALAAVNSATLRVRYSTIVDNQAAQITGGVLGPTLIESSILAGNNLAQTDDVNAARNSCIEGFTGGGTNNSGAAVAFLDRDGADGVLNTADDDLTLQAGSCGLDGGDDSALSFSTDVLGRPRVIRTVDAGAFEAP